MIRKTSLAVLAATVAMCICAFGYQQEEVTGDMDITQSESSLQFQKYELLKGSKGEDLLGLFYQYTNNSSEASMAMQEALFQLFQNGRSLDSSYIFDGDAAEYFRNSTEMIKDGASVPVVFLYELRDTQAPVELEITNMSSWNEQEAAIDLSKYNASLEIGMPEEMDAVAAQEQAEGNAADVAPETEEEVIDEAQYTMQVQQALAEAGYDTGAPDGKKGPRTSGAISQYKQDHGLPSDSVIDRELLVALGIMEAPEKPEDTETEATAEEQPENAETEAPTEEQPADEVSSEEADGKDADTIDELNAQIENLKNENTELQEKITELENSQEENAAGSVDLAELSACSDEEITSLLMRVEQEIADRNIEKSATIPAGEYLVGKDLPSGTYTVYMKHEGDFWGDFYVYADGSTDGDRKFDQTVFGNESSGGSMIGEGTWTVKLEEGDLVKCTDGITLTVFAGVKFE